MADPTLALTFQELAIRVAEYLGMADYSSGDAALPTDAHDLALVKRLVNDGYRRFLRENPRWNFMTVPLSLTFGTGTVSGDNSRYFLPDDFGGSLVDPLTYGSGGPYVSVQEVPEDSIRQWQAGQGLTTGTPVAYALRAINTTATTTAQRWEAVFWPTPAGTETIAGRYRRWPAKLANNTDHSVAGFQHDEAVLNAALAAAELDKNDTIGSREARYQISLAASKKIDAQASSPRILDYGDKGAESRGVRRYDVATYNGNPL